MEPCGTPEDTNTDEEEEPFTTTCWVRLEEARRLRRGR